MNEIENSKASGSLGEVFTDIYQQHRWGKGVGSGEGSDPVKNEPYLQLLQKFIREMKIKSVIDLGCGDWQFSRRVDWSGVDYLGIDVVPTLVEELKSKYARDGIRFIAENILTCDLPDADLVISKDVLQHLPNESVLQFLERLPRFKYAILTNDRRHYRLPSLRTLWNLRRVDLALPNRNISAGGYRPIRLKEPPFNLHVKELLRLEMRHVHAMHIKEVLLWENRDMSQV